MISIRDAVMAINPKAKFGMKTDDIDSIQWVDGTKEISKSNILAKQKELQEDYDAKEYQRKRVNEYPPIGDQLDDLYHNGIDGWKKTIKAIKDKYPKG